MVKPKSQKKMGQTVKEKKAKSIVGKVFSLYIECLYKIKKPKGKDTDL